MKKKYEKEVASYLTILNAKTQSEVLKQLHEELQNLNEDEVVSTLGSAKTYAESVLEQKGFNSKELLSVKENKSFLVRQLEAIFKVIEEVISSMGKNNKKENAIIIRDILIILLIVIFLKIPFLFVRDLLADFFLTIPNLNVVSRIVEFALELVYIVVAVMVFLTIFKRRFSKNEKND